MKLPFEDEETRSLHATAAGPRIVVVWGGGTVSRALEPRKALVLGRGKDCDVPVLDATVSRRHARVHPPVSAGDPMRIEDLGSAHGVWVDGERIRQARDVWPGQLVEVGGALVMFQDASVRREPTSWKGADIDRFVALIAQSHIPVLIVGEAGAGKEFMAERIHRASGRKDGPLVRSRDAGDADIRKARGGTLLLDEAFDLSEAAQAALVRELDARLAPGVADVRVLAATRHDLDAHARAGRFRQDLLYRLSGARVHVPPLRERRHEIVGIAEALLQRGERALSLTSEAERRLVAYAWPGNVRELMNVLERASALVARVIDANDIVLDAPMPSTLPSELEAVEKQRIVSALASVDGNQTKAAALLGISRRALINRLDAYGLPRPRKGT